MTDPSPAGPEQPPVPRRWLLAVAMTAEAAALPREHPAVLDVLVTGIGKVNAAARLAHRLARLAGERGLDGVGVLNVGTCGGLRDGVAGVVRPSEAWAWDVGRVAVRAQPGEVPREAYPLVLGDGGTIATGDSFVADEARRAQLAARAVVVDMECAALAQTCHGLGVPLAALKWVSDGASEGALRDFAGTLDRGARELGRATAAFLDAL
ncbi:adenosylhomocysteine nucleosidase [Kineococcus xinjiangensis]|uniref:Adenosylhomocysteine nucleosidase n=1 Tax=Kineococcus xinjiangensis TaxID=512762 RepID=A0A2S6IUK7_9ACTN|nr:nucleosidase [Kineococcus xinjiangensis]PPK97951.1 adenosylhomocysteine nucleosidase [Kineococcus xinjiangensis]